MAATRVIHGRRISHATRQPTGARRDLVARRRTPRRAGPAWRTRGL